MNHLLLFTLLMLSASSAQAAPGEAKAISLDNWRSHPAIKEVEAIRDEIDTGISERRLKIKMRRFNTDSPACLKSPAKSKSLATDADRHLRLYQIEQPGPGSETITLSRYYDSKGTLRFVHMAYALATLRIYLDSAGKVFWGVEQNGEKYSRYDSTYDYREINPRNAEEARDEYYSQESCPDK